MRPLLAKLPPARRALLFLPLAAAASLVTFVLVGFLTNRIVLALVLAPLGGVGGGWLLVGWPTVERKDGKPLVDPALRPWLFFPLLVLFALVLYPFLGLLVTPYLPPAAVVYGSLAVALVGGGLAAYLLAGFPTTMFRDAGATWSRIPAGTRPWLSIPGALLLTLLFYFLLGLGLTRWAGIPWAPLIALPVGFLLGTGLAVWIFGVPKPERSLRERVPRPPGNARPLLLLGTFLLLGPVLAFLVGGLLALAPVLPLDFHLPTSILAGFLLAFGASALIWGLPHTWRELPDYTPGVTPEVQSALLLPVWVAAAAILTLGLGVAGLTLVPALALGLLLGLAIALFATGAARRLRSARPAEAPAIPEKVKPLLFFPTSLLLGGLVFVALTWILPGLFALNLLVGALVGLAAAFVLLQRDLLADVRDGRARRRALLRELKEMETTRLAAAPAAAAAAPAESPSKRGFLGRFGRRK